MDLYGIDLNLLVAFDALIAERSVTKAGKRIGRTQPAMSAALSRLRALFDDQLFVRGKDGLQPTPRAVELAEPLGRALAEIGRTLGYAQSFKPAETQVTFNIAMQEHAAHKLLERLVGYIQRRAPAARLNVRAFTARDEAIRLLDTGEMDVAVGVPPSSAPGRIFTERLFEEPFVCVVRKGHPTAGPSINRKTFLALDHLLISPEGDRFGHTDTLLAQYGLKRSLALTLSQMYLAPQIIARSDLIAILMLGVVEVSGWTDRLTIMEPPFALEPCAYVMSWHRRNDEYPAQRWLRACVRSVSGGAGYDGQSED